jgi:molecular chaperone DnaJ
MKNYYEILGVSENSSQDEIKKSYRKLSKQYHPDVNPEGIEKFKEISEAYENIGDETKRTEYDNKRKNPFAGFSNNEGFDIHSMFEQMMGKNRKPKAPDKVLSISITPIESYFGVKKEINYQFYDACQPCNGQGGERVKCGTCNGTGVVVQIIGTGLFRQQIHMSCQNCNGQGSTLKNLCKNCNGAGSIKNYENLSILIPSNVDNGDFIRLKNKGDYYANIKLRGDVVLKVGLVEDEKYEKSGLDLIYKKKINALDLIINDNIEIEHPEGILLIKVPENFDSEKPLRIPNKGYKSNTNGNFYIKISVVYNKNLEEDKKNKIKELFK